MTTRIVNKTLSAAVIAGLVGFSTLGFAQSKAVQALDNTKAHTQTSATAEAFPQANTLASELDAFNRQDTQGRVVGDRLESDNPQQPVSQVAMELSSEIDAYNADAGNGLVPSTHMPADAEQSAYPQTQALAAELTRYNEMGGNLDAIRF